MYLLIIMAVTFLSVFTFTLGIYKIVFREKLIMAGRLSTLERIKTKSIRVDEELNKPFFDRVIKPIIVLISKKFVRFMPVGKKNSINNKLVMAGTPGNFS